MFFILRIIVSTIFIINASCSFAAFESYSNDCSIEIKNAEAKYNIPSGLLKAIANVESNAKPFVLNNQNIGFYFDSYGQAYQKLVALIKSGETNIDVGCMQINLHWHGSNFNTLQEMLIPSLNVDYPAQFLTRLFNESKSWHVAVRQYHSKIKAKHKIYSRKVLISWLKENKNG